MVKRSSGRDPRGQQKNSQLHPPAKDQRNNDEESNPDEEIDEDEAFNSDDERKYGSFFMKKSNSERGVDGDDDDGGGGGDDDDDDGEDEDGEGGEGSEDDEDEIADVDDHRDDDSEGGDLNDSGQDDEDGNSEEGDGGQYMLDLLDRLSSSKGVADKSTDANKSDRKLAARVKESEFSSSVVKSAGLTLDSLMESIKDTKGFGALAKTMKRVATGQVEASPLPRVAQERLERKVHYDDQTKKISAWTHAVQENRQAETLDFRPQERLVVTKEIMIEKFVPKTEFEKELDAALEAAGKKDEEAIFKAEEKALTDDLGANKITLEEFKKRRGQLAKMRALMFYHERKRYHINKIKSKKYRRIRKRQRERQKEEEAAATADADTARELQEKEEIDRIRERMTLAHKNTSQWAKRVLKRGKRVDLETRRALSAQLKRGDDLLKKMKGTGDEDDGDDDDEEDLVAHARKVLEDAENPEDNNEVIQGKGLFQLAFMQRGIEKERQRAKEEARQLLLELEADAEAEAPLSNDDEENEGEVNPKNKPPPKKKMKPASKLEMESILREGEKVVSDLTFGNSTSTTVSGAIEVGAKTLSTGTAAASSISEHKTALSGAKADPKQVVSKLSENKSHERQSTVQEGDEEVMEDQDDSEANPWMIDPVVKDRNTEKQKTKKSRTMVDVDRAVTLLDDGENLSRRKAIPSEHSRQAHDTSKDGDKNNVSFPADKSNTTTKTLSSLSQKELVQLAFAANTHEVEDEFEREKQRVAEEDEELDNENPTRSKAEKFPKKSVGWGSWTGLGSRQTKPMDQNVSVPSSKSRQRDNAQDSTPNHVIVRQKRLKSLAKRHMLGAIPYPYTSREEYELSIKGGVGPEWNVHKTFAELTRPAVLTSAGKIIRPIPLSAKKRGLRSTAKF